MGKRGPKPKRVTTICACCDEPFDHPAYQERRFCSSACAQEWFRTPAGKAELRAKRYGITPLKERGRNALTNKGEFSEV